MNQSYYCPLASGSKGNSILFKSAKATLLIDVGLSGRATQKKLEELGCALEEIDAILITHEHSDHIAGIKTLAIKHGIPVLANGATARAIAQDLPKCPQFKIFSTGESFSFLDIDIYPFSIQHDTMDPVAFTLQCEGVKLGFCTDLGFATSLVRQALTNCHYLFIEANHEESFVHACSRPLVYKQRVLGRSGHLSNAACATLLNQLTWEGLQHIYLAHLSEECNNPKVALETMRKALGPDIPIQVAPQHQVGERICFEKRADLTFSR